MQNALVSALRPALVMTSLFALLLGIAYPLTLTLVGQAIFPHQANGSLIVEKDRAIGSELIGQSFTSDRYFHGRTSAAGAGYDGMASSGSNLGPASQALSDRVKADVAALRSPAPVPVDLVTTSGSGLDPDVSPAAALLQVARVARARGLSPDRVKALVNVQTKGAILGFIGEPRVNILALNRQLDRDTVR